MGIHPPCPLDVSSPLIIVNGTSRIRRRIVGNLCEPGRSWQDPMLSWFDGRVGCQETKRYLDNSFAVTCTRPGETGLAMYSVRFSEGVHCYFVERVWDFKMSSKRVASMLVIGQKLFQVSSFLCQHCSLTLSASISLLPGSAFYSRCSLLTLSASIHASQHHPEHVLVS